MATKPIYIRHETEAYRLEAHAFGSFVLVRKSDGASAYFQGDDANLLGDEMGTIETVVCERQTHFTVDRLFDNLAGAYDDILTTLDGEG